MFAFLRCERVNNVADSWARKQNLDLVAVFNFKPIQNPMHINNIVRTE